MHAGCIRVDVHGNRFLIMGPMSPSFFRELWIMWFNDAFVMGDGTIIPPLDSYEHMPNKQRMACQLTARQIHDHIDARS